MVIFLVTVQINSHLLQNQCPLGTVVSTDIADTANQSINTAKCGKSTC